MKTQLSKLWAISLILIATFAALIIWGVESYRDASRVLTEITKPDYKSELIHTIVKNVYESDVQFNYFIYTNDDTQQERHTVYMNRIDSLMQLLQTELQPFEPLLSQLDSLSTLIGEKALLNSLFIQLKKQQNSRLFINDALNRIKVQLSDSAYIDNILTEKQELIIRQDTVDVIEVIDIPEEYRGIGGFIRKLFGIETTRKDTLVKQDIVENYNMAITEKSYVIRDYSKDSTLIAVKTILFDVLNDEIKLQQTILNAELELIKTNERLLTTITSLLGEIETLNLVLHEQEQLSAIQTIERAHKTAFIIAGIGIFLGLCLLMFLFKDISQANAYRKELEIQKVRAEELASAKEAFLSGMSHEIRTPLHSISGLSYMLSKDANLPKSSQKRINGIMFANQYLRELIDNILEQAKINTGKYKIETGSVSIPKLTEELKELFSIRELEQATRLDIQYEESLNHNMIKMDQIKLKQILINLIGNAFKFTQNGTITVQFSLNLDKTPHELHLSVSDNGIGIHPDFQESIFEPFTRVDQTQTANMPGTGLGLSITKHIVNSFGGTIS